MAAVIRSGRNPTMRHLSRTHGISISWLHEQCRNQEVQLEYITTTLMAADTYTKAFQDAVKWTNLCQQINLIEITDLTQPHIHALFSLLLSESSPITGKNIQCQQQLMPEEFWDWDSALGWHERENVHYIVVREPNLYRTCLGDFKSRTTWLKNSTGWFCAEKQQLWHSLPNHVLP